MSIRKKNQPVVLTYSAADAFARCPTGYRLAYVDRLKSAGFSAALSVGSGLHKIAEHAQPGVIEGPLHYGLASLLTDAETTGLEEDKRELSAAKLKSMWRSWQQHQELPEFAQREQVGRRKLCSIRGLGQVDVAGKVDGVLLNGSLWELKTCSSTLDEAEAIQRGSIQVPLYQWMVGSEEPAYVELVRKPTIRLKKDESATEYEERASQAYNEAPAEYFRRFEIPHDPERVSDAVEYMEDTADHIGFCARKGKWPRRYGSGCRSMFGWCPYKALCWHGDMTNYRQAELAHEELGL